MDSMSQGGDPAVEGQPDPQVRRSPQDAPVDGERRVLIADDEAWQGALVVELLAAEGYVCDCVGSVRDALAALTTKSYDAFITDIHMPGNDTLAFLDDLRARGIGTPIIVLTGHPTVSTAIEAVHHSVHEYLLKPVEAATLSRSVATAVGKGRLQRSLREVREKLEGLAAAIAKLEAGCIAVDSKTGEGRERIAGVAAETVTLYNHVLQNLRAVVGLLDTRATAPADVCDLLVCRRRKLYDDTLRDAVDILRKTKDIVKLKELAGLRKQFESVLKTNE